MKVLKFTSLDELNTYLAEQGLSPLPQGVISEGIAQAAAENGVAEDDLVASFTLSVEEEGDEDDLEGIDIPSILAQIFGQEATHGPDEAGPAPEATVPKAVMDSYIEFSSKQIARLVEERDDARKLVVLERQSHERCHENFEMVMHRMRLQGYAESIAAGLFPGKPFETLDQNQQEVLMRQAEQSIENIDTIRAALQSGNQASASVH